ncbi:zinc carboxypeptidase family protein (macronuclear) [Tetrahymena thermophila SB210]|uniref:Zinc carboxypeptidase family protein n=1 Tax=Tetrahymena thermophila (strain SB210) TaxID=312017 RepID=Q22C95_TETTS|nr:zinc carboxypeptidase family protein [Tetrahymena thermophila SB210]EAR82912.1 zinc carboxypeptidase family protein [Tetrahymena thermophila SB210]|eukprot:XP_001030575.1 zinc carboxypeptidase family protein [Tetrahymena thermophila SB210]
MKKYDTQRTVSASNLIFNSQQNQQNNPSDYNSQNKAANFQGFENKYESASFQSYGIGNFMNPINYSVRQTQSVSQPSNVLKVQVNNIQQSQAIISQASQNQQNIQVKKQNFIVKNGVKVKSSTFYNGQANQNQNVANTSLLNNTEKVQYNQSSNNNKLNVNIGNSNRQSITSSNANHFKNNDDTFSSDVSGGFSSEDDTENQRNQGSNNKNFINQYYDYYHHKEEQEPKRHYLEDLPPQPIIDKPYSLEPDMLFGWVPKIHFNGPIPLNFKNSTIDKIIRELGASTSMYYNQYKLCYIGFRPYTSLQLHQQYSGNDSYTFRYDHLFTNDYPHLAPFFDMFTKKFREPVKPPFQGNNPLYTQRKDILKFDSIFESGNLDIAVKIENTDEYDLFMRVDSNTKGHFQWYYFKVQGASKGQKVKFNICNFYKKKSLYTRGMKPYILSEVALKHLKKDWTQEGNNVSYTKQNYRYNFLYDEDDNGKQPYQLSFEYEFLYENDTVWFAFCVPYTFTKLIKFLKETMKQHHSQNKDFITEEKLCQTMSGIDVPLLTVTDNVDMTIPYKDRKVALISARIHPGESNGSWLMHGFLQFLFGDSEEAKKIRKNTIFKIIPMLNPDGVIAGNYRTGFAGRDLNRVFHSSDKILYPTIVSMKDLTLELKRTYGKNFNIFIDLHGHSVKKNVFVYGPEFPIYDLNYYKCRIFPKLMGEQTDMFRYYSSIFKISPGKKNTGRAILFSQFDIQLSYTIEASNGSFYRNGFSKFFNSEFLLEMGVVIGKSLQKYITSIIDYESMVERKRQQQQRSNEALNQNQMGVIHSDDENNIMKKLQLQQQHHEFLVDDKVAEDQKEEIKENIRKMKKKEKKIDKKKKRNKKQEEQNAFNNEQLKGLPFSNLFNLDNIEQDSKPARQDESDNYSEGGSDSESSDEDYDKNHIKMLQKNISVNREMFKSIFKNVNNKKSSNQTTTSNQGKRNSRKGRSLLSTSKDPNKNNLSDSNQKIRNNSTSTENREQKVPEKKGIYVSKTIHMRPLTAYLTKKNSNVEKIEEEQANELKLKEYNSNRPSTVGQKKNNKNDIKSNNQNSKKNLLPQQNVQAKEQLNVINFQQTVNKNAQKPPINGKQNASKTWLLMMKSVSEYEQEKKQKLEQVSQQIQPPFSQSREDFFEEIKERGTFSNYQGEINKNSATNKLQKQAEQQLSSTFTRFKGVEKQLIQQEELELKNINQILINTPNSIVDPVQEQYFRKSKQEGFKPKGNCPSAFYAMKKHFNLKKREEDRPQQDKNFQRIPLLGNNKLYQSYQAKVYGQIPYRDGSLNNNITIQNNIQNINQK